MKFVRNPKTLTQITQAPRAPHHSLRADYAAPLQFTLPCHFSSLPFLLPSLPITTPNTHSNHPITPVLHTTAHAWTTRLLDTALPLFILPFLLPSVPFTTPITHLNPPITPGLRTTPHVRTARLLYTALPLLIIYLPPSYRYRSPFIVVATNFKVAPVLVSRTRRDVFRCLLD